LTLRILAARVWAYSEGVFLRGILTGGSLGTIESASPTASVCFAGLANLSNGQKTDHAWNSGENRSRLKANLHRHATHTHTHTQPFNGLLSGTTRVGRYLKKHSPTHAHPDHRTSFITFLHLQRSMASSLFSLRARHHPHRHARHHKTVFLCRVRLDGVNWISDNSRLSPADV